MADGIGPGNCRRGGQHKDTGDPGAEDIATPEVTDSHRIHDLGRRAEFRLVDKGVDEAIHWEVLVCDENGHPCDKCAYRGVECVYPNALPASSSPDRSGSIPLQDYLVTQQLPSEAGQQPSQPSTVLDRSNKLLIELMHKYSTETYKFFFTEPFNHHIWQVVIPQRALDHDFLLYGILSVAALHTALTKEPSKALEYIDAAIYYQSQARKPFQDALHNISSENCDAVFAHSIITIINGIAFPQVAVDKSETCSMLDTVLLLFELVQGTSEIHKIARPWLLGLSMASDDFWGKASDTLDEETDQALARLHDLNHQRRTHDLEKYKMINEAIASLRRCFQRFRALRDPTSVLTFLATVSRDFVNCLRRHEPLPILVLLHWGVLLAQLDGKVWWASNSGLVLVSDALNILHRSSAELGSAMLWPKQKLGL
ncbi:C6 transcription factor [Aspergillus cavernicola]|uniref:C6 transcription factor n=1 Tax=Aspergillus cavernicola TaxID=176166 RepID=A0ABR4INW2_9EURO